MIYAITETPRQGSSLMFCLVYYFEFHYLSQICVLYMLVYVSPTDTNLLQYCYYRQYFYEYIINITAVLSLLSYPFSSSMFLFFHSLRRRLFITKFILSFTSKFKYIFANIFNSVMLACLSFCCMVNSHLHSTATYLLFTPDFRLRIFLQ